MVEQFQAVVDAAGSQLRYVILEENGGDHGLLRGLGHATYSNMMHRLMALFRRQLITGHADFGFLHGYANCLEAFQGMDVEQAFPQGQIFFLPNMTWAQPTYYVIQMVANSYQPYNMIASSNYTDLDGLNAFSISFNLCSGGCRQCRCD